MRDISSFQCNVTVSSDESESGQPLCLDPLYPSTLFEALKGTDIDVVLSVDQIGLVSDGSSLYLHHLSAYASAAQEQAARTEEATAIAAVATAAQNAGVPLVSSCLDRDSHLVNL